MDRSEIGQQSAFEAVVFLGITSFLCFLVWFITWRAVRRYKPRLKKSNRLHGPGNQRRRIGGKSNHGGGDGDRRRGRPRQRRKVKRS